jgi:hypothetical protein
MIYVITVLLIVACVLLWEINSILHRLKDSQLNSEDIYNDLNSIKNSVNNIEQRFDQSQSL